jgi:tetratricopeptide (TPR) repeat protein
MGKGARNRQKRRASVRKASTGATADAIVQELLQLKNLREFMDFLRREPALRDPSLLAWFDQVAQDPHFGALFASLGRLLRDARSNSPRAWAAYDARRKRATEGAEQVERLQQEIQRALDAREFDEVIPLADQAIPLAAAAGLGLTVGSLENQRGQALFQSAGPNRADRIEESIASFHRAIELSGDADARAGALMHLGLALGERVLDDHADNLDAAVDALDGALSLLSESSPAWLFAIIRTNLAWSLLRRERGERLADLQRAEQLCQEALMYRSLDRDPGDWTHTQLNLGEIRARLLELGVGELGAVEEAHRAVIDAGAQVEPWLVGAAHSKIGRVQRQTAHLTPE